jgi:threonine synthase
MLPVGWTPLLPPHRLREYLGTPNLFVKDDGRNPTASFKDRATAVVLASAIESGRDVITCASTGNAAVSLAGLCAAAGLKCIIFVPGEIPLPKLSQLAIYGARILMIDGTYDQAFDLCEEAVSRWGWFDRNTGVNPCAAEGKKTAAFEICEQLEFQLPDAIVLPVGDGCIMGGLYKGFRDFRDLGLISSIPALIGVQSAGCNPLVTAFRNSRGVVPVIPRTGVDSIAVGNPRDSRKALRAASLTGGDIIAVDDEEIFHWQAVLARQGGIFAESAASASVAGYVHLLEEGTLKRDQKVVLMLTGSGLKDLSRIARSMTKPAILAPRLEEIAKKIHREAI